MSRQRLQGGWLVFAFAVLALAATLPFWLTDLDLRAAEVFHTPIEPGQTRSLAWPLAERPLFVWLYRIGSGLSWLCLLVALLTVLTPHLRRHALAKRIVCLLMLTLVLGPGLLVNGLGKDFTGRPRPRTVAELGGQAAYQPPWQLGTPGTGKSFPCGHCSVGFAVGAAGLGLLQASRLAGFGVIVFSLLLGGAIGLARMADGAHFLSDILWSALLTWAAALSVDALLARWRAQGVAAHPRPPWLVPAAMSTVAFALLTGLLFARPFHQRVQAELPAAEGEGIERIVLDLDVADLEVRVDPAQRERLRLAGEVKGYGTPNIDIVGRASRSGSEWRYRLERRGWSSEIEAPLLLSLHSDVLPRLVIRIREGSAALPRAFPASSLITGGAMSGHGQKGD